MNSLFALRYQLTSAQRYTYEEIKENIILLFLLFLSFHRNIRGLKITYRH